MTIDAHSNADEIDAVLRGLSDLSGKIVILTDLLLQQQQAAPSPSHSVCVHRAEHRPGRPSRLDKDPELRAFVLERLQHMSFPELETAIAAEFPPDRRIRKSAVYDWWKKHFKP